MVERESLAVGAFFWIPRQVLVKVTDSNEATICQIPRGRRAPDSRCDGL